MSARIEANKSIAPVDASIAATADEKTFPETGSVVTKKEFV
jgi:hypothetical protein